MYARAFFCIVVGHSLAQEVVPNVLKEVPKDEQARRPDPLQLKKGNP
jgi:hypothetical protein